jgi:hypothetical protein
MTARSSSNQRNTRGHRPRLQAIRTFGNSLKLGGVVCSKTRSHLTDARKAILINRYCSSLNNYLMFRPIGLTLRAAPAVATRGHPRLTKAGNSAHLGQQSLPYEGTTRETTPLPVWTSPNAIHSHPQKNIESAVERIGPFWPPV